MLRYPRQVLDNKLKCIRFVVFASGGVIFNQFEWEGLTDNGRTIRPRRRSHVDGQGISFLRAIGLQVALATSADSAVTSLVERWNSLPSCRSGAWLPVSIISPFGLEAWAVRERVLLAACAFLGAEFAHWEMLSIAGFRAAAGDAAPEVKRLCDWVAIRPGGAGAVREFADYILRVRGIDPFSLATS